jgi:hypothetical protein
MRLVARLPAPYADANVSTTGWQRALRLRAHAGRNGPAGHLARALNDDSAVDSTENVLPSRGNHPPQLPERRLEARPWQRRDGYCGKLCEHEHYFPSRVNRFCPVRFCSPGMPSTRSRTCFVQSDILSFRGGMKSLCFLAFACQKLGTAFTFTCTARAYHRRKFSPGASVEQCLSALDVRVRSRIAAAPPASESSRRRCGFRCRCRYPR